MFFVLTLALSILYVKQGGSRSAVQEKLSNAPAPAATPIPSAPPTADAKDAPNKSPLEADAPKAKAVTEGGKAPDADNPPPPPDPDKSANQPPPAKPDAEHSEASPATDKSQPIQQKPATPPADQGPKPLPPPR
jgi:hypothetical protein